MRELKFRTWDTNNNQWHVLNAGHFCFYPNGKILNLSMSGLIFQQYTGLKDINDKEIYEGDIVSGHLSIDDFDCSGNTNSYEYTFNGVIKFEGCGFYCENADFPLDQYEQLEIIGNIFENPELLKK